MRRFLAPSVTAIRCIAPGTLLASSERSYEVGREYVIVLNRADPLQLRVAPTISLSLGQKFRVVQEVAAPQWHYRVQTTEYWYQLATDGGVEIVAFHWTPEATEVGQRAYPHLHLGPAMLSRTAPIFPGTFHKKHLPTGRVSVGGIVRFAIEELGVPPLRPDWSTILGAGSDRSDPVTD